jgi:hypothetical protein
VRTNLQDAMIPGVVRALVFRIIRVVQLTAKRTYVLTVDQGPLSQKVDMFLIFPGNRRNRTGSFGLLGRAFVW